MIKELLNEYKKIFIVGAVIFLFLFSLKVIFYETTTEKLVNYMDYKDFVLDGDGYTYKKQLSELDYEQYSKKIKNGEDATYENVSFNVENYKLIKNELISLGDEIYDFMGVFNYKTEKLNYSYRFVKDGCNAIFEGKYNIETKKFTCKNIFSYGFDIVGKEEEFCEKIKYDVEDFYNETFELIDSAVLIKEMKK